MSLIYKTESFSHFWSCKTTWKKSSYNTLWCLLGCSIGDFGAILYFQFFSPNTNQFIIFITAIICGITTSIILETIILLKSLTIGQAFKTAIGMSIISMVSMEIAMNLTDYLIMGSLRLNFLTIFPCLIVGFITPLPYNYWRLKAYGKSCH